MHTSHLLQQADGHVAAATPTAEPIHHHNTTRRYSFIVSAPADKHIMWII